MEKKDIFQDIQNIRSSNPVIVLGSGASVSYGIPGMGVLANELKNFFKSNPYYDTATNDVVSDFIKLLDSGVGLEAALLDVKVPEIVEADIVNIVWKVIIESDAKISPKIKGMVMKNIMPKLKGKADSRLINQVVDRLINN